MVEHDGNIIVCRKAERCDIETLTELLCELYVKHSKAELFDENKALFADSNQIFFLAYVGDNPVGVCHCALRNEYINGKEYDGPAGYLEAIYVKPDFRLKGIASALVSACEVWAGKNGCREFLSDCLLDNIDSYNFHLHLGFFETERCIFFRKELISP